MLELLTEENGRSIGAFFKAVVEQIPEEKKMKDTVNSVHAFLKFISDFGVKDYIKLRLLLTEKNGQQIGAFFKARVDTTCTSCSLRMERVSTSSFTFPVETAEGADGAFLTCAASSAALNVVALATVAIIKRLPNKKYFFIVSN